jgi:hypothetical protein
MRRAATVSLLVLAMIGSASPAFGVVRERIYTGTTSQDHPISLELVRRESGALLFRGASVEVDLSCEDASTMSFGFAFFTSPGQRLDGRTLEFHERFGSDALHITGLFRWRDASGTFRYSVAVLDENEEAMKCTTGDLTWTATRP